MMPLLVVTSDATFGELIRQNLEESGRFNVSVRASREEAEAFLRAYSCPLVFLDTNFEAWDGLAESLRRIHPTVRFVLLGESERTPASIGVNLAGRFPKPFYLPDLFAIVNAALIESPAREETGSNDLPVPASMPWLADVNRAAQHLTRLTLESSAQAALITHQEKLWAYAGQLPQTAARELAEAVSRYWDRQNGSDLVRFIRLESTHAEHMLYATSLGAEMVLALVFDAETSFTTIRNQASRLVRSLSNPSEEDDSDLPPNLTPIAEILADVPPPNPPQEFQAELQSGMLEYDLGPTRPIASHRETSPSVPPITAHLEINLEDTLAAPARQRESKPEETLEDMDATLPSPTTELARKIVLEPVSPSAYNLTYACLLIPRFAHHHLTGDLAERLSNWMPQLCVAYGWRLEYLAIRPDYLQWIVNVPPPTPPSYVMRVVRQQTSTRILEDFSRLKKENPSGDFWAPGYLIMGGNQPHPPQLVRDYIAQIRQRQGFKKRPH